jgi:hypothetical protein
VPNSLQANPIEDGDLPGWFQGVPVLFRELSENGLEAERRRRDDDDEARAIVDDE